VNCQKDDEVIVLEEQNAKAPLFKTSILQSSKIQENKRLRSRLQGFNKKKTTANKTVYSDIHGFTINTDFAKYLENQDGTYHSYTFTVYRDHDNGLLENLLVSLQPDGSYKTFLVTYDLTEKEKNDVINGIFIANINTKTTFQFIPDSDLDFNIFKSDGCGIVYVTFCGCNVPSHRNGYFPEGGACGCFSASFYDNCYGEGGTSDGIDDNSDTNYEDVHGDVGEAGDTLGGGSGIPPTTNDNVTTPTYFKPYKNIIENCIDILSNQNINTWYNSMDPNDPNIKALATYLDGNCSPETGQFALEAMEALIDGTITNDEFTQALAEPYIVISPETPIANIADYLVCFNLNQNAELTIYIDQPVSGSSAVFALPANVGHAFIGITQGNNTSVFGVYPAGDAHPWSPMDTLQYGDNSGDSYDISITTTINSTELTNIINGAKNNPNDYNLNSYNCTDYATEVSGLSGINLPSSYSNWAVGGGNNPGKIGEIIRGGVWVNQATPGTTSTNLEGGTSPSNNKDCD